MQCAQRQLFASKRIDDALVNLIAMHIKWLEKHLIAKLPRDLPALPASAFDKTRTIMSNIVQSSQHPLHRLRKLFVKQMTNFLPYYTDAQIGVHEKIAAVQRQTALTPLLGAPFESDIIQRRQFALIDAHVIALKIHLASLHSDELTALRLCHGAGAAVESSPLAQSVAAFIAQIEQLSASGTSEADFDVEDSFGYLTQLLEREDLQADRFVAELLPLREYFALKSLNIVLAGKSEQRSLNRKYFEAIQSLGIGELQLFNSISSDAFAACEQLWHSLWQSVDSSGSMLESVAQLPLDFYQNYASFRRSLTASLQSFALRSLSTKPCADPATEYLWGGPVFTTSALTALFDAFGQTKSCGLVNLESWQNTLQQLSQLLWNNVDVFQADFSFE